MDELSVASKGQVTIPKAVRLRLGIRAGSRVRFALVGDHAGLQVVHAHAAVQGSGAGIFKHERSAVPADFDVASLFAKSAKQAR